MSILKTMKSVIDSVSGGFIKGAVDLVTDYIPDPEKKAELKIKLERLAMEKTTQAHEQMIESAEVLDKRINEQEGTAHELKSIPYIGALIIFLRAAQRPVWGYAVLYYDYQMFAAEAVFSDEQTKLLWVINLLVLGFLFGERAIKNIMPLVTKFFESKKA